MTFWSRGLGPITCFTHVPICAASWCLFATISGTSESARDGEPCHEWYSPAK